MAFIQQDDEHIRLHGAGTKWANPIAATLPDTCFATGSLPWHCG